MKFSSILIRFCLCLILALGAWWAASSWIKTWKASIITSQATKSDAAWRAVLSDAGSKANDQLLKERSNYEQAIRGILADRERLRVELQQRLTRAQQREQPPTAAGDHPAGPQACSGDRLAREDASFLAGYAADAAEQQEQLKETTSAYETCREALRKATQSKDWKGDSHAREEGTVQGIQP